MMRLLLFAATEPEISPTLQYVGRHFEPLAETVFVKGGLQISTFISSPGQVHTLYGLERACGGGIPDHLIHAGIAGAYNTDKYPMGSVVQITSDAFGDLGVEEKDGRFTPAFSMGLLPPNTDVFQDGWLYNEEKNLNLLPDLPRAKGVSVNRVSGSAQTIAQMEHWYAPDVETMESAAFFFYCLTHGLSFNAVRAISNKVEPRDRSKWNIPLAIQNLNSYLIALLDHYAKKHPVKGGQ